MCTLLKFLEGGRRIIVFRQPMLSNYLAEGCLGIEDARVAQLCNKTTITFVGLSINFPTKAILMASSAFLLVSNVKFKFGGASVRLNLSSSYLITTLPVRRLAYRHRIELDLI